MTDKNQNRRAETISLGKGQNYAKVATRLLEMHADCSECSIETKVIFKDGWALSTCKLTTPKGYFTGHALGPVKAQKALEKLESISVGRALAFAGYLASGEIATYEEMTDGQSGPDKDDPSMEFAKEFLRRIHAAASGEELDRLWKRVGDMITDETISPAEGELFYSSIRDRREFLTGEAASGDYIPF